jgi:hypothetical protein
MLPENLITLNYKDVEDIFRTATPVGVESIRQQLKKSYEELKEYSGEPFGGNDKFYKSMDSWLYLYELDIENKSIVPNVAGAFMAFLKFYIPRIHEGDGELD